MKTTWMEVMRYNKTITLSNGMECCLRNGTESDRQLVNWCGKQHRAVRKGDGASALSHTKKDGRVEVHP